MRSGGSGSGSGSPYDDGHFNHFHQLQQEWRTLRTLYQWSEQPTLESQRYANRNRYREHFTLDHSRVRLGRADDYINANFISNCNHLSSASSASLVEDARAYIATQAPLPSTFDDFWQMVWEQGSQVLVMLTRTLECSGIIKAHHYWPSLGERDLFGSIQVTNERESSPHEHIVVREFVLQRLCGDENDADASSGGIASVRATDNDHDHDHEYEHDTDDELEEEEDVNSADGNDATATTSSFSSVLSWLPGFQHLRRTTAPAASNNRRKRGCPSPTKSAAAREQPHHRDLRSSSPEIRRVVQVHYVGWPDQGAPSSLESFIALLDEVERHERATPFIGPMVVHCSAGIGRTGSFCAIHSLMRALRNSLQPGLLPISQSALPCRSGPLLPPRPLLYLPGLSPSTLALPYETPHVLRSSTTGHQKSSSLPETPSWVTPMAAAGAAGATSSDTEIAQALLRSETERIVSHKLLERVISMRHQRNGMVQSFEQYQFAWKVLMHLVQQHAEMAAAAADDRAAAADAHVRRMLAVSCGF